MDETFAVPEREVEKKFLMSVDQAMNISGRGTVVTGTIEQGAVKINQDVHLIGIRRKHSLSTVTGIETFNKQMDKAEAGDNIGVLLRGLNKD